MVSGLGCAFAVEAGDCSPWVAMHSAHGLFWLYQYGVGHANSKEYPGQWLECVPEGVWHLGVVTFSSCVCKATFKT